MIEEKRKKGTRAGFVFGALLTALALGAISCSPRQEANSGENSVALKPSKVRTITEKEFDSEVIKAAQPVVVKFYADWCPPCKVLTPIMEELANDHGDKVKFVAVDADQAENLGQKYQIEALPTVLFFKKGQIADRVLGLEQKEALRKRITAVAGQS